MKNGSGKKGVKYEVIKKSKKDKDKKESRAGKRSTKDTAAISVTVRYAPTTSPSFSHPRHVVLILIFLSGWLFLIHSGE